MAVIFAICLAAVDQLIKYLVLAKNLPQVCNEGIAWGLNMPWAFLILVYIALIIVLFIKRRGIAASSAYTRYSIALICAGAFSNLFDRIIRGCVVDYIDVGFWPVFNLADIFIVLGIFVIAYSITFLHFRF